MAGADSFLLVVLSAVCLVTTSWATSLARTITLSTTTTAGRLTEDRQGGEGLLQLY